MYCFNTLPITNAVSSKNNKYSSNVPQNELPMLPIKMALQDCVTLLSL